MYTMIHYRPSLFILFPTITLYFICLSIFWFFLSWHLDKLLMSLGLLSVILVIIISYKLNLLDSEASNVELFPNILGYWIVLFISIITSCFKTAAVIIGLKKQNFTIVEKNLNMDQPIYLSLLTHSITITPGTVTVQCQPDKIIVQSLFEHKTCNEELDSAINSIKNIS